MRPSVLNPLFASASGIKGIGQKLDKVLAQFLRGDATAPTRIVDLLFHLPSGVVDRRFRPKIADLPKEGIVTIEVKVGRHKPPPPFNKRLPYRVEVSDQTGSLTLVFFMPLPTICSAACRRAKRGLFPVRSAGMARNRRLPIRIIS